MDTVFNSSYDEWCNKEVEMYYVCVFVFMGDVHIKHTIKSLV